MRLPTRFISLLLVAAYVPVAVGCHSTAMYKPADVPENARDDITGVILISGVRRDFRSPARGWLTADSVLGTMDGKRVSFPRDSINQLVVRRSDDVKTFFTVIGVAAGVVLTAAAIVAATKESCPFVYSWNGEQYMFDAEPYGGAITKGLARDDFSELEHLRAVGDEYRLLVTNEVNESQMTDLMELWVIDHPSGVRPVADDSGRLYGMGLLHPPTRASDQSGRDLVPWLRDADELAWEAQPVFDAYGGVRDTITVTFARPAGVREMRLVARVSTGAWGSHSIRSMLGLRGSAVEDWYRHIDAVPAAADSVRLWSIREGLYGLPVEVREGEGWQVRGILPGGGPLIAEDRVIPLDLRGVQGDSVVIRLRPARGFWSFNRLAADFTSAASFIVDTVRLSSAIDRKLGNVTALLTRADDRFHPLPETGDEATLRFAAPPERPGLERTVLLHSRGWYRLRGLPTGTPNDALIARLTSEPDFAARLAAEEYRRALQANRER